MRKVQWPRGDDTRRGSILVHTNNTNNTRCFGTDHTQYGCGRPQSDVLGAAIALSPPEPTWLVLTHPVGDNILWVGLRPVIDDHHRRVVVALSSA